jgi:Cytochrome c554 and c-prime
MPRLHFAAWSFVALLLGALLAACHGCHGTPRADSAEAVAPGTSTASPTIRLYAISNLAGALEPCGCTKDQLGGIDHLAAFIAEDRKRAQGSLVVAAGPTMFLDPKLEATRATQDKWKSEAISESLADIGLSAWTPGFNDWAGGAPLFASLAKSAQGSLVAANLEGAGAAKSALRDVGGIKVGIAGVSSPEYEGGRPEGVTVQDPTASLKAAVAELRQKGANILVGLASVPRGEALRLAEAVPELSVLVVGKPVDGGEANDAPPPPVLVGSVLVIGTSNHLQTVGVVDFFVHGKDFKFQDATGVANAESILSVSKRIRDLENRLAAWEHDPSVRPEDVAARRADLARLRDEKERLSNPPAPKAGSFFRYQVVEVRARNGTDAKVEGRMKSYYRRVNDHNRTALADRKPPPVAEGQSRYVGVEVCATCHEEAKNVWDKTAHARAYSTLSTQFKEFNLDCVSCHVTGYEKPGGSTVTMNASLRDVQCEECHGPGQAHVKTPKKPGLITREPKADMCARSCHHPPHVEAFDPARAKQFIVGPGHGLPENAPWPAWATDGGTHP